MPSLNILNLLYSLTQLDIFLYGYTIYSLIFTLKIKFQDYSMYKVNLMKQSQSLLLNNNNKTPLHFEVNPNSGT